MLLSLPFLRFDSIILVTQRVLFWRFPQEVTLRLLRSLTPVSCCLQSVLPEPERRIQVFLAAVWFRDPEPSGSRCSCRWAVCQNLGLVRAFGFPAGFVHSLLPRLLLMWRLVDPRRRGDPVRVLQAGQRGQVRWFCSRWFRSRCCGRHLCLELQLSASWLTGDVQHQLPGSWVLKVHLQLWMNSGSPNPARTLNLHDGSIWTSVSTSGSDPPQLDRTVFGWEDVIGRYRPFWL